MHVKAKLNQQKHTILSKTGHRLGVCYGWFHLYCLIRAVSHAKIAKVTKEKFLTTLGLESTISRLLDWRSNRMTVSFCTFFFFFLGGGGLHFSSEARENLMFSLKDLFWP